MNTINISDITKAIEKLLKDNLSGFTVTRNYPLNESAGTAAQPEAWVGIYRANVDHEPYAMPNRWKSIPTIAIVVQVASIRPEFSDLEDKHEAAIKKVLDVLLDNTADSAGRSGTNLRNTVNMINDIRIEYEIKADESSKGALINTARILLEAEGVQA